MHRRTLRSLGLVASLTMMATLLSTIGISSALAAAPTPVYGTANVDGDIGEWSSDPIFAGLYIAGNPDKPLEANGYLRYSCSEKVLYVMVNSLGNPLLTSPTGNAWASIDGEPTKRYTDTSGNDGTPPDFAWVGQTGTNATGYEASFALDPGDYTILVHVDVGVDGVANTAAFSGLNAQSEPTPLSIKCGTEEGSPEISIVKKTNGEDANMEPGPAIAVGAVVTWTYLVTNTGDVELSDVYVADDQGVSVKCPQATLKVGETMTCTAEGTAVAGQYANIGKAVGSGPDGTTVHATDPSHYYGMKDLGIGSPETPTFTRTYEWDVSKSADKTVVKQTGGTAVVGYQVIGRQTGFTDSLWRLSGDIDVTNPNALAITGVTVTSTVDNGGSCVVTGGTNVTVPAEDKVMLPFVCSWTAQPSPLAGNHTETAIWDATPNGTPTGTASEISQFTFDIPATTEVNRTTTFSDTLYGGVLGTLTATDAAPFATNTWNYSKSLAVPANGCVTYDNTASILETGQQSQAQVKVCGPEKTGALSRGYWTTKTGEGYITGAGSTAGVCKLTTYLRTYNPFKDLSSTASCTAVRSYTSTVFTQANASNASNNTQLKAQMLATGLNVYFSDPGLGGNLISAPSPVGSFSMDLTQVCVTTCIDASAQFGGSPKTVNQMMSYASSQSNTGGTTWYGNVKTPQINAKTAFEAINIQKAFGGS